MYTCSHTYTQPRTHSHSMRLASPTHLVPSGATTLSAPRVVAQPQRTRRVQSRLLSTNSSSSSGGASMSEEEQKDQQRRRRLERSNLIQRRCLECGDGAAHGLQSISCFEQEQLPKHHTSRRGVTNRVQLSVYPDAIGAGLADLNGFLATHIQGGPVGRPCCGVLSDVQWRRGVSGTAPPLSVNLRPVRVPNHSSTDAIGSVHLLPLYPSSGDRGFAPLTYQQVDPAYGERGHATPDSLHLPQGAAGRCVVAAQATSCCAPHHTVGVLVCLVHAGTWRDVEDLASSSGYQVGVEAGWQET
jgi:hypothetical protein